MAMIACASSGPPKVELILLSQPRPPSLTRFNAFRLPGENRGAQRGPGPEARPRRRERGQGGGFRIAERFIGKVQSTAILFELEGFQ